MPRLTHTWRKDMSFCLFYLVPNHTATNLTYMALHTRTNLCNWKNLGCLAQLLRSFQGIVYMWPAQSHFDRSEEDTSDSHLLVLLWSQSTILSNNPLMKKRFVSFQTPLSVCDMKATWLIIMKVTTRLFWQRSRWGPVQADVYNQEMMGILKIITSNVY